MGIGGEYPLSATISAEASTTKTRGTVMAAVMSVQGIGNFSAPLVAFTMLSIRHLRLSYIWRIAVGFGAIPCILTAYHRIKMEESSMYKKAQRVAKPDKALIYKTMWRYKWTLLGTALSWFLFDITFYGNALFKETVVQYLLGPTKTDARERAIQTAQASMIIAAMALPGYWLAVALIDFVGRKYLQLFGFFFIGLTFLVMGIFYDQIIKKHTLFVVMYGLTFFFSNIGPSTTTYVVPGEVFPTQIRATCHGISSAAGKAGAVLGVAIFETLSNNYGYKFVFYLCAEVALMGFFITAFFVPEMKAKELQTEEVHNEEKTSIQNSFS